MEDRTETLRLAKRLERAGRWSEAVDAYRRATGRRSAPIESSPVSRTRGANRRPATVAARRSQLAGLVPGTELAHREGNRWGRVVATCTYAGEGRFIYAGVTYETPSAAARAARRDLGMSDRRKNGWWFWGIERQESPRVAERSEAA